jgi:regulatory protein
VWHKKGVRTPGKARRAPPPLNDEQLQELALRYVGRFATTRAKLRAYLSRKLRERGWDGQREPDLEALANRFVEIGYIDDAAYALSKSRTLSARGYGKRRLTDKLRVDGVGQADGEAAVAHAEAQAVNAALRFAERRRLGPYATTPPDPRLREKWIAAMVRAGHPFNVARVITSLPPGSDLDPHHLSELADRSVG